MRGQAEKMWLALVAPDKLDLATPLHQLLWLHLWAVDHNGHVQLTVCKTRVYKTPKITETRMYRVIVRTPTRIHDTRQPTMRKALQAMYLKLTNDYGSEIRRDTNRTRARV